MMKAPQPEVVATASRQNPGETLRQAREQKGLSLSQVAGQLNLTENSLRQLENGAFDKLPGHTFSRGYIRAYAKLMGLDQAELVNSFDHFTGTNASGSTVQSLGRVAEPVRLSRNVLRIVSLLLLALLIGFAMQQFSHWVDLLMPSLPDWLSFLQYIVWLLFVLLVLVIVLSLIHI